MTTPTRPMCGAPKADGTPCRSTLNLGPSGRCLMHDEERATERRAMRVAGGKAARPPREKTTVRRPKGMPPIPRSLADAEHYFAWIADAIGSGTIDARSGHEMAYALNGYKAAAEKRELTKRVSDLSALVKTIKKCPACAALATDVEGAS